MVEDIIKKVTEAQAKADLNIELIGDLLGDQLRQDSNVVPRLEKLEKQQLLCKLREELKNLKGGENMPEEKTKHNPADFNQDGIVSEKEMNLYSFLQGISKESNQYYRESTANAQTNAKWMALGSMAFLALLFILDLLKGLVS